MDPGTAMLVASGVGAAANVLGGFSARSQAKDQAEQQMAFQERMASTAYQRARADMEAAGLNPALMYGSGGPASAPSGAQAPIENILEDVGDQAISSALEARRLEKEIDQAQSVVELNHALKSKAEAETVSAKVNAAAAKGYSAIPRKVGEVIDSLPSLQNKTRGIIDKVKDMWQNRPWKNLDLNNPYSMENYK